MSRASVPALRIFLEQPARPADTLTYHEVQGFLFAVVCAPELVRPAEWLPLIFNEHEAGYASLDEANAILQQIMALYNEINAAVLEERVVLPSDCQLRPGVLDNLEDSAPLARWSRGFLIGHEWLEDLWDVELPGDRDEELGVVLMTLSFFSSRGLAEAFHQETAAKTASLEEFAASILCLVPDALAEYADFGRSVLGSMGETAAPAPKRVSKTGRNDPCPCGSEKKFKQCCGEIRHRRGRGLHKLRLGDVDAVYANTYSRIDGAHRGPSTGDMVGVVACGSQEVSAAGPP